MSKAKLQLDEAARVREALNKSGVATRIAQYMPEKFRKKLAALVAEDGSAQPGIRDKVILILQEAGEENKATIEVNSVETKGVNMTTTVTLDGATDEPKE